MTSARFSAMTEQEQRDLAQRLADNSEVFDFRTALEVVQFDPAEAEELLQDKTEMKKVLEELERANQRLRIAAREFR